MLPVNKLMEYLQSFPPQGTHPYPHHYYPTWIPPQTKVEATKSPGAFEPWAYGSSYGYPNPGECHSCCNHSYPTGYYGFRPPHSHLPPPPPPQFYYHGPYSPYVESFPTHYLPPLHSIEHPKFVIDKSMPVNHCYGCPNHMCSGKEGKGVKIEEHTPEAKEKASEPLGLTQLNNYPNQILWVPPEFTRGGVGKSSESDPRLWNGWFPYDMKNNEESSQSIESEPKARNGWIPFDLNGIKSLKLDGHEDKKQKEEKKDQNPHPISSKSFESEPKVWNGWIPIDLNGIKSLKQVGHEDKIQNEEKKEQSQPPILWVPFLDKPDDGENRDLKENKARSKDSEEQPKKYTFIPLKFPFNDNCGVEAGSLEDNSAGVQSKVKEDKVEHKSSPVTPIEDGGQKKTLEDSKKNPRTIPVMDAGEQGDKVLPSNKISKKRSPSPPKATKLPPVCLRVDPLPRRKSRSLSPPSKENMVKNSDSILKSPSSPTKEKVHQNSNKQDFVSNKENEVKSKKEECKVVEVVERKSDQVMKNDTRTSDQVQAQAPVDVTVVLNEETIKKNAGMREDKNEVGKGVSEQAEENPKEAVKEKKELSQTEAAIQIQSMYRGYEARRWEPLKKLRQIAKVREQVEEVREQISSLESSNTQNDVKQKMVIGETIMSLLLQLDTVQGLHPSVRDVRKAVARELICLQEKLDSLNVQVLDGPKSTEPDEVCNVRPAEEEDKREIGHASEYISAESTEPKDSTLEKDQSAFNSDDSIPSNSELKESEPDLLETFGSKVEEAVQRLVDKETVVDAIEQQHRESVEPLSFADMENEVKNEGFRNNSEVMVEFQMENEDLKVSPNEPVDSVVADQESDQVAESNENIFESKVGVGSAAAVAAIGEVADMVNEVSHTELHCKKELPIEVREEEPVTSHSEDEVNRKFGKTENLISDNYAEPNLQDTHLVGERKPVEPLLEERSHAQVPTEAQEICDGHPLGDANTLSPSTGIPITSLESMEATNNAIELLAEEYEVPKVEELIPEETHSHGYPSLSVDALENVLEKLPAKEQEEMKELEAMADKEGIVDYFGDSEIVQEKVMELTPASEQVVEEEERSHTPHDANVNGSSLDNNNLVKENEKLREMLKKLIEAGNEQLNVISDLNGRVKDLEKKLTKKKKLRMRRQRTAARGSQCVKNC